MFKINTKRILLLGLVAGYVVFLTGCALKVEQPTPEEQADYQRLREAMAHDYNQKIDQELKNEAEEKKAELLRNPIITLQELKNKVDAFGVSESKVNFVKTREGITFNGKSLSDTVGHITQIEYSSNNGFITYLVEKSDGAYFMKFLQATSNIKPIVVAKLKLEDETWTISSITGEKYYGNNLQIGSNGYVIVGVDGTGYISEHGKNANPISISEGYRVAKFQNGDVVGSKTILLEIPEVVEEEGSISSIFSKAKALGSMLGVTKKQDYAFFDLSNNKLTKINIPNDGKSTLECIQYGAKVNKFVTKCLKYANPVESLYKQDGEKNFSHYYWRVKWFNTNSGVIALTQEDDLGKIYGTNLSTGKKVLIKRYLPGYNEFDASIQSNGKLKLSAKKGMFGSDDSEDVEADIAQLEAIVEKE